MGRRLRVVVDIERNPITTNDELKQAVHEQWRAAQRAYADILRLVGTPRTRWLVVGTPGRPLRRDDFAWFAREARDMATAASALADAMEEAASLVDRREAAAREAERNKDVAKPEEGV